MVKTVDSWDNLGRHDQGCPFVGRSPRMGWEPARHASEPLLGSGRFGKAWGGIPEQRCRQPDLLLRIRSGLQESIVAVSIRSRAVEFTTPEHFHGPSIMGGEDITPAIAALRALARAAFPGAPRFAEPADRR